MNIGVPPLSFWPLMQLPPSTATRRAQPKSAIMAWPSAPMSTFRPLTSQCATPAAWTCASPRRMSRARDRMRSSSHRPPHRFISSASDPPGAYSRNRSHRSAAADDDEATE
uniref:Uncharacterized protein n=1 Tax=Arundo donax TaxID=35708 RepID=A0A0A9GX85_ARUDO